MADSRQPNIREESSMPRLRDGQVLQTRGGRPDRNAQFYTEK